MQLSKEIKDLLDIAITQPKKRTEMFIELGTDYFKKIHGEELQLTTLACLQYFIDNESKWVGRLTSSGNGGRIDESIPKVKSIWYDVREHFMWATVYPKEVVKLYDIDSKGMVVVKAPPKVRFVSKDEKKEYEKNRDGVFVKKEVNQVREFVLSSGFTLGQKHDITVPCLTGVTEGSLNLNPLRAKKEAPKKKEISQEKVEFIVGLIEGVLPHMSGTYKIKEEDYDEAAKSIYEAHPDNFEELVADEVETLLIKFFKGKNRKAEKADIAKTKKIK